MLAETLPITLTVILLPGVPDATELIKIFFFPTSYALSGVI